MAKRLLGWLDERWPFREVWQTLVREDIPGGASYFYSLGSATLLVFVIQAVTGILQLLYYVPTADHAYDSINYLRLEVPFGWLIHGLHYWGAQAMVVLVVLHLSRVFTWGAHRKPRELTWLAGVFLLLSVLAMVFTGAGLPWDVKGYWASEVGTSMVGTVPLVGGFLKEVIRGAESMGQLTIDRFFVAHVAIIPGVLTALLLFHLVAFRRGGPAGSWNPEARKRVGPFWPDQVFKDVVFFLVILIVLIGLSAWFRAPITGPADPTDLSVRPKPEWNFLFLYQALKIFRGPLEPIGTVLLPLLAVLFLLSVPFIGRGEELSPARRPWGMAVFGAILAGVITLTITGALSRPGQTSSSGAAGQAGGAVPRGQETGPPAGAALFLSAGCSGCHTINGQGGQVGPDLSDEGAKRSPSWIAAQITNPKSHSPDTIMPSFASRLSPSQVKILAGYISSLKGPGPPTPGSRSPERQEPKTAAGSRATASSKKASPPAAGSSAAETEARKKGARLFQANGCSACHTIDGRGGRVGPDLSNEGNRGRAAQWIEDQIRDPRSHYPSSPMPSFATRLSSIQIKDLAEYLLSLKTKESPSRAGKPPAQASGGPASTSSEGARLFESLGCVGCHTIHGSGGQVGPDLSAEGSRGRSSQWIADQIRDPRGHYPGSPMPSFAKRVDVSQVQALVDYLMSLKLPGSAAGGEGGKAPAVESGPPLPSPPTPARRLNGPAANMIGDAAHGGILFQQTCQRCHGPRGTDKIPNPGSDDGTVPPLNPIDPGLKNPDPQVFADNVDRFIQHGSIPSGPDPERHMPDFGDSHTLTQQAIANLEAYVLSLNGVDRSKIMNPGVSPTLFFFITLGVFGVAGWIIWLVLPVRRRKASRRT
jgi:ubiquinol-cytochrome c reductase cytochrome b subunit